MYGGPQLPGRPPNDNDGLVSSLVTGTLLALFFFSPLGTIFFGVFNSLILLGFSIPVILFVGFQLFNTFATVKGACPSCGSLAVVLKGDDQTNVCLNCGGEWGMSKASRKRGLAFKKYSYSLIIPNPSTSTVTLRATKDKKNLEVCNSSPFKGNGGGFGGRGQGPNVEDFFRGERAASYKPRNKEDDIQERKREKRETKIIDIDGEVKDVD